MNLDQFQQQLVAYASEIGIDKIGFASAEPFYNLKHRLIRQQQLNYQSGFEESDVEKRTRPELLLEEPVSIIAIAIARGRKP
jgi:epoxyqueuosine reductase